MINFLTPFLDIIALANDALIVPMRKKLTQALLRAFTYPFTALHKTLHATHEAYAIDYMRWGSQICLLEQMLNEKFSTNGYTINIGPGRRSFPLYIYLKADNLPFFMTDRAPYTSPYYGQLSSSYGGGGWDFTVNIPHQLGIQIDSTPPSTSISIFQTLSTLNIVKSAAMTEAFAAVISPQLVEFTTFPITLSPPPPKQTDTRYAQINQLLKRYKLAGKQYKIVSI